MIIDAHAHLREGQGEVADFIAAMDEVGIDKACVSNIVRNALQNPDEINRFVFDAVQRYPDRLIGFACLLPQLADSDKLLERYVRDYGMKGLKLHPPIQDFSPTDPSIFPVVEKAIELDIPILFHTGPIFVERARLRYADPILIDDLALAFPEAKIIIGHGDPLGYGPVIAGKHKNVYMDTTIVFARIARFIPGIAEETLEWMDVGTQSNRPGRAGKDPLAGADKLLFGTDAVQLHTHRFKYGLEPILNMQIPQEAKAKILGGNIARLLKLSV